MLKSIAVCLSLSLAALPVHAKTIHRQAYKVCEAQEEAYWNGSSAQCCDTSEGKYKLVKNYKNGVGEAGYACCEIKEDEKTSENNGIYTTTGTGYTLVGAVNGSCCGGYASYHSIDNGQTDQDGNPYWTNRTSTFSVRQNGGKYFCAEEYTETAGISGNIRYTARISYESDSRWCVHEEGSSSACFCSDSGDPKNGEYCD